MTAPRDPARMAITVEAARVALRQAGPTSGLYGAAAADVDAKLTEIAAFLKEIDERKQAREAAAVCR